MANPSQSSGGVGGRKVQWIHTNIAKDYGGQVAFKYAEHFLIHTHLLITDSTVYFGLHRL